ncbi:ribosome maturation factor RimP [Candidiatus Paracoxiella cheracis]|uniref:ribosome maturation factor RimP n=1 Tax=Candidiatus Paracoxiella cheracis TaxID=3405120 RepID=UPI003BF5BCDC
MIKTEQLQRLLAPTVESLGYELVGCELHSRHRHSLLRVYVDRPEGVTLDDCAKISRQISAILDVEDLISGSYDLEVSSPGIERPLFALNHYQQYIGRGVKLRLRIPREGQRNYKGVIKAVEGEKIILQLDEGSLELDLSEIDKAKLTADFANREKRS